MRGLKFLAANDRGDSPLSSLWVCFKTILQTLVSSTLQPLTVGVTIDAKVCRISGICVSTAHVRRRRLWSDLFDIYVPDLVWLFIGDFNCILGAHQKREGCPLIQMACDEFVMFTNTANLIHMQTHGAQYT